MTNLIRHISADKEARTANQVDGLTAYKRYEVRLSHHCTYGSRIQRFIKLRRYFKVIVEH
jgi:hypothetical protein